MINAIFSDCHFLHTIMTVDKTLNGALTNAAIMNTVSQFTELLSNWQTAATTDPTTRIAGKRAERNMKKRFIDG